MSFCDGLLVARDDNQIHFGSDSLTSQARELADAALHQFEDRWPDVKMGE